MREISLMHLQFLFSEALVKMIEFIPKKRTEITVIRIFKSFCSVFFMLLCLFFLGGDVEYITLQTQETLLKRTQFLHLKLL